tara:strand:+ start:579 stop:695 length:117 start_codon:yes stop_codon:yes gene_type:complete
MLLSQPARQVNILNEKPTALRTYTLCAITNEFTAQIAP